jgi:hypothetical protein
VCLLTNFGKRIPEAEIREEQEALHIHVQAVMELRSRGRDQDAEKDRPLTPHFMVSVAHPELRNCVHSADSEKRWRRTMLQKCLCNANDASALGTQDLLLCTQVRGMRGSPPIWEVCHPEAVAFVMQLRR